MKNKISQQHRLSGHKPNSVALSNSIESNSIAINQYTKEEHMFLQTFKNVPAAIQFLFPDLVDKKIMNSRANNIYAVCHKRKPSAFNFY